MKGTKRAGRRLGSKGRSPCAPFTFYRLPTLSPRVQMAPGTRRSPEQERGEFLLTANSPSSPARPELGPYLPAGQLSLSISPKAKTAGLCVCLPHPT